jgi:hypothetical protein
MAIHVNFKYITLFLMNKLYFRTGGTIFYYSSIKPIHPFCVRI